MNDWSYLIAQVRPFSSGKTSLYVSVKSGFYWPNNKEFIELDHTGTIPPITDSKKFLNTYSTFILIGVGAVLPEVISWRDSILEGNSCEKFVVLDAGFSNVKDSPKKLLSYTVRKVDQYILVELDRPVLDTSNEKWQKEDCFKVEQYDDTLIDRKDWKNEVSVRFQDASNKYLWSPKTEGLFRYFYDELIKLTKRDGSFEEDKVNFEKNNREHGVFVADAEQSLNIDFVRGEKWSGWTGGKDDWELDLNVKWIGWKYFGWPVGILPEIKLNVQKYYKKSIIDKFNYVVFDEYNKHLLPPFYFKKSSDGNLLLYKYETGKIEVFTNVYLKNDLVYSTLQSNIKVPFQSIKTNVFIGELDEEQKIRIFDVPTGDVNYNSVLADLDETNKDLTDEGINYIKNRKLNSFMIKEVKA